MKERLLWKARISKLISCHVVRSVENYVRFERGHGANVLSILKAITLSSSGESWMAFMDRFDKCEEQRNTWHYISYTKSYRATLDHDP